MPELQPPAVSGRRFEQISKLLKINHPTGKMIYTWHRFQKNVDLSRIGCSSTKSRYLMQIIKKVSKSFLFNCYRHHRSDLLGQQGNKRPTQAQICVLTMEAARFPGEQGAKEKTLGGARGVCTEMTDRLGNKLRLGLDRLTARRGWFEEWVIVKTKWSPIRK